MAQTPSIILYDDGDWSEGHYQSLFCLYTEALLRSGLRVHAVCPQPGAAGEWIDRHCPEYRAQCAVYPAGSHSLKSRYSKLKPLLRLMWFARAGRMVRRIYRLTGDRPPVFFMNINHLRGRLRTDRFTDRLLPFPWAAMIFDSSCFRQTSGLPGPQILRRHFSFLSAKNCKAFGVFDEKAVRPLQETFPRVSIVFLPDATPEAVQKTPLEAEITRCAGGRKIVGLLGMLHKRKGLLTALKLAKTRPDLFFLFAGAYDLNKLSPSEKDFVQSFFDGPPENCFLHLQRIEDEAEFNALVQLTDIIFAVYPGFTNSSGLLTKAGIFERPCLVSAGNTCMADRVQHYNLGLDVPAEDVKACSAAIDRLFNPGMEKPMFEKFKTDFNGKALRTALQQLAGQLSK